MEAFLDIAGAVLAYGCGGDGAASVGVFADLALPCLADSFKSEPGKRPHVVKILFAFAGYVLTALISVASACTRMCV